ncbi:MAG: bacterial Ig-like domain-containing protein [Treponema sp.]|nr:bacterial Ig-like domain-containing protein [Treponema sp.]
MYELGETLNISGLVVTGTYADGTTKAETVSLSNISGYNANTVGQQTLTVTIDGKTTTFTITVNNAALQRA